MTFVSVIGDCYGCKRIFSFNPDFVPSLRVNGIKEPFCKSCIDKANPVRIANGLEPLRIHPMAYEPNEEE